MATLTLSDGVFAPATDLSDTVTVELTGVSDTSGRAPTIRQYAGGRLRAIVDQNRQVTLQLQATIVTRSVLARLQVWSDAGTLLLFRDPRGRAVYGTLQPLQVVEYPGAAEDFAALTVTFTGTSDTAVV